MAKLVSKVYGDALFSLALEEDNLDSIWEEVKMLSLALKENNEFTEILSVLDYFQKQAKEYNKIGVVEVTTPTTLTGEQKTGIEEKLIQTSGYQSLEMSYIVNPALLGGIRIRIGDRVVDNSIQTKLEEMTRSLSKVRV